MPRKVRKQFKRKRKVHHKRLNRSKAVVQGHARAAILNILTVPNYYDFQYGETVSTPTSLATIGFPCKYFTMNTNRPRGTKNPEIAVKIGFILQSSALPSIKFFQTNFKLVHTITNASNVNIKLTKYLCEFREDMSNINAAFQNPLILIGQGFATAGIDTSNPNDANIGLLTSNLTPFQSPDFCQKIKILKSKTTPLKPGQVQKCGLSDRFDHVIRPNDYMTFAAGQTYQTGTLQMANTRGEKFYLFRIEPLQVGDLAGSSAAIASSICKINMVTTTRYEYKWVDDLNTNITSNITGISSGTGAGGVDYINLYTAAAYTGATS